MKKVKKSRLTKPSAGLRVPKFSPDGMCINLDEHRTSFDADGSQVFQLVLDLTPNLN